MTDEQFRIHVVRVLEKLTVQMTDLVGNGQPGRIAAIASDVDALKKARWTLGGVDIRTYHSRFCCDSFLV